MAVKSKAKTRQHLLLARRLIRHYYGNTHFSVSELSGGLSNYVYLVKLPSGDLVIRISDRSEKLTSFLKEQWAAATAIDNKIPAPEILEVGNDIIGIPYMIVKKAKGVVGTDFPNRMKVIYEMGAYTSKIHAIRTTNYGNSFDWCENVLSKKRTWKEYFYNELNVLGRLDILATHRMIYPKNILIIKRKIKEMEKWRKRSSLNHGDIRLKNFLVNTQGKVVSILDWENCTSNIAPYWDLSISLHDLTIDEQEQFLKGYGIAPKSYTKMAPYIKVLNILHYAPFVEELIKKRAFKQLEQFRSRINGSMDMYSF